MQKHKSIYNMHVATECLWVVCTPDPSCPSTFLTFHAFSSSVSGLGFRLATGVALLYSRALGSVSFVPKIILNWICMVNIFNWVLYVICQYLQHALSNSFDALLTSISTHSHRINPAWSAEICHIHHTFMPIATCQDGNRISILA